ncbi:MAG: hypothetical protein ACRYF3_10490 [Janthinobacterium lividum]
MILPPNLHGLLHEQQGLLTREQLYEHGISRGQLRWALGRSWRLVHSGVVATTTGRLDPRQQLTAAQLFAGPDAQFASTTAARYYGLTSVPDDGVRRLLVPFGRESREAPGISVRRTRRPDPHPRHRGPLTYCSPPRAIVDTARSVRGDDVTAIVIEGIQRRLVTLEQLSEEVEAGAVQGSAAVRRAVLAAAGGAWSLAETDFLDLLSTSRVLPSVMANPELFTVDGERLPSPDAFVDAVALALQIYSRRHHLFETDWEHTLQTDTALGAAGVPVMAFSPRTVRTEPARVLASVERAYLNLAVRGTRPGVVARPRTLLFG